MRIEPFTLYVDTDGLRFAVDAGVAPPPGTYVATCRQAFSAAEVVVVVEPSESLGRPLEASVAPFVDAVVPRGSVTVTFHERLPDDRAA